VTLETLPAVAAEFRSVAERASIVVLRVGRSHVIEQPAPTQWSIAECLTHLTMVTEAYLPIWRDALVRARAEGLAGKPPFRLDLWGRFWVWFLEPPPKVRFPAPNRFVPLEVGTGDGVLDSFLQRQDQVLALIGLAEGLAVDRIKIPSTFEHRVRYSVWSSFRANLSHQRRHLWQAERVAEQFHTVTSSD
jgi:hypothetical protein